MNGDASRISFDYDERAARLVVVGAHPDDVEIGVGGTIAACVAAHLPVSVVILTDEREPGIAGKRRSEARAAAAALGVDYQSIHFLGFADGDLKADEKAIAALSRFSGQLNPESASVFVHTRADRHPDHRAANVAVCSAFANFTILAYPVINSTLLNEFQADLYMDITRFWPQKELALRAHASQERRVKLDELRKYSQDFGRRNGVPIAEPFRMIQERNSSLSPIQLSTVLSRSTS